MKYLTVTAATICLVLFAITPGVLVAQNMDCTIIVPAAPLTAKGLSTPYRLVATNPANGPCNESNANQSAFVQAGIFDPATNKISVYNPLVIDVNATPAVAPVVPTLPANAIVALWFGYNGNNLTLQPHRRGSDSLRDNNCVNGVANSIFGQFAYCNAVAFFNAANQAIANGQLVIPPLAAAKDGKPCPTVRSFYHVDQDQSDNLPVSYLLATNGRIAQNITANRASLTNATTLGNPSDNGLLDKFVDPALGCTPVKGADLADPGQMVPALPLNELQARSFQTSPVALVPAGDPMVLNNGVADLTKVNLYRQGVDQPQITSASQADTTAYCRNLFTIQPAKLVLDQDLFVVAPSPVASIGNNLLTFMAARLVASFTNLNCASFGVTDPVAVTTNAQGVAIAATVNGKAIGAAASGGGGNQVSCHVTYTVSSQWPTGFKAAITIANAGAADISNWTLQWTFPGTQQISSVWNGTFSQSGANVTITAPSFAPTIPAHSTYTGLGFVAGLSSNTNPSPTTFTLNGTPCN